jgi:hypothetical protein
MKTIYLAVIYLFQISIGFSQSTCFSCKNAPAGTIFCDDFEDGIALDKKYFEINTNGGDFIVMDKIGRDNSHGIRIKWQKGEVSAGGLSKSFGKTPDSYIGKNASAPTQQFDEIYWRMDVKAQPGWTGGGPAKLSRALCLANSNWAEGMMAHLWSGGKDNAFLGMDPASGIGSDGKLKSTKYNDFNNLRWLGWKQGITDMFSDANAGKWYCVVGHVKLNTPGLKDGVFEFWINDTLQASNTNIDWHGTWNNDPNNMHINAIFFENYWNDGSPVDQERYFDNIVIGTKPLPCQCQVTGTFENYSDKIMEVFPNPVNDEVTIIVSANQKLPLDIFVCEISGKLIKQIRLTDSKNKIQLLEFNPGVYLIKAAGFQPVRFVIE